jgi:uncharacterized protein YqgC (DUF456 family)
MGFGSMTGLEVLIPFVLLVLMGVGFSLVPGVPGPPFAAGAVMLIPFFPPGGVVDRLTWWVAGATAFAGLMVTVIDICSPWLAKLYEGALGKSSRQAAIGSIVGLVVGLMVSTAAGCAGIAVPIVAAVPIPLVLITPFVGACIGELLYTPTVVETDNQRWQRVFQSALVQWLGLLTTVFLKVGYCLLVLPIGGWLIYRLWAA